MLRVKNYQKFTEQALRNHWLYNIKHSRDSPLGEFLVIFDSEHKPLDFYNTGKPRLAAVDLYFSFGRIADRVF